MISDHGSGRRPDEPQPPELPTGTVTFLFTDIVGSTTLWQAHRDTMPAVIARHDAMLTRIAEDHGGVVFQTVGDAIHAAFGQPIEALHAAIAGQQSVLAEEWGAVGALHVRMAIHAGQVEVRDGVYMGHTLNRVARIVSATHGDQILLSHSTQVLLRDHLPPEIRLRDLGEHRLKDLVSPEHLWQVLVPDLPGDFPPLVTPGTRTDNLPTEPTRFIGRDGEVAALRDLLHQDDVHLVTLTGPGGIGKTRLAIQAARQVADAFPDGVCIVSLGSVSDVGQVPSQIAAALGLRETGGQSIVGLLEGYVQDKRLLLILDNFEQVIEARTVVAALLASSHGLKVVVTSRQVLRLSGEHEYPVPALPVPPEAAGETEQPDVGPLMTYDAVALFVDRARSVRPDFAVTPTTTPVIAEITRRLDGLPLAIELAAARVRLFPPEALLRRLDHRLQLLTSGPQDRPARQQTLRAAIDWSYQLLTEPEKALFSRLSVFSGGCDLEAVEAVCGSGDGDGDVLSSLEALTEHSLVHRQDSSTGDLRIALLETLREFAAERLEERGEMETLRERHAEYYAGLVLTTPDVSGAPRHERLGRFDEERENIRSALEWCRRHRPGTALLLGAALWGYWFMRGEVDHLHTWLDDVAAQSGELLPAEQAHVLTTASLVAYMFHDPRGDEWLERSMALREERGDPSRRADALQLSGAKALRAGHTAQAAVLLEESLRAFAAAPNPDRMVWSRYWLAIATEAVGDYERTQEIARDALTEARMKNDIHEVARWTWWLGRQALLQGDTEIAEPLLEQSLAVRTQLADQYCISESRLSLAALALARGDLAQARTTAERNLDLVRRLGNGERMAWHYSLLGEEALLRGDLPASRAALERGVRLALEVPQVAATHYLLADLLWGLVGLAAAQGELTEAARLAGQAMALFHLAGRRPAPGERARYDRYLESLHLAPESDAFRQAQAEYETLQPEEILSRVRRDLESWMGMISP